VLSDATHWPAVGALLIQLIFKPAALTTPPHPLLKIKRVLIDVILRDFRNGDVGHGLGGSDEICQRDCLDIGTAPDPGYCGAAPRRKMFALQQRAAPHAARQHSDR
jgi:hypothetical protein